MVYVIATPDRNWYGPYASKDQAEDARYDLRHPRSRNGRYEPRAMKVTTAHHTDTGIAINWPNWAKH